MRWFWLVLVPVLGVTAQEWELIGLEGQRVTSVAVSSQDSKLIYAASQTLYRSRDGGETWEELSAPADFVGLDPGDPNAVYTAFGQGSYSDGIYRSLDQGDNWELIYQQLYATSILVIPLSPIPPLLAGFLDLGHEGGAFISPDSGRTWYPFNEGLMDRNVLCLYALGTPDPILLAGTLGGIQRLVFRGALVWEPPSLTLPTWCFSAYEAITPLYAASGDGSYSDGIYKSADRGANWAVSFWLRYPLSVLVNPLDSLTVFAGDSGTGVCRTRDGGENWEQMSEGLGDSTIHSLAQSQADTSFLYAGTDNGIYRYDFSLGITVVVPNGGEIWYQDSIYNIEWSASGEAIDHIRLTLSTDGGGSYDRLIVENTENDGVYEWRVPDDIESDECRVKAAAMDSGNNLLVEDASDANFTIASAGIAEPGVSISASFELYPAQPNPFRGTTQIRYTLPRSSEVSLVVYGSTGNLLRILVDDQSLGPGVYTLNWDGRADDGESLPSGIYFLILGIAGDTQTQKLLLMR